MKAEKHKQKQLLGVKHGWFWAACDASSHGLMATWVGLRITRGTPPARGGGGNQWNRTRHGQALTEVSPRTAGEPWGNRGKTIWRLGYRIYSLSVPSCSSRVVNHYFICILSLYSLFYLRSDNSKLRKICFSDHHHENLPVFLKWSWVGQCLCLLTLTFNTMRLFCSSSLLFFLFSLPILSTPFLTPHCPLLHFTEDSIISIWFLDLNYFVFISFLL